MGEAVGVAEFVEDDGEGEAALQQALLLVEIPAAAVDVEHADALGVAKGRILRIEIGAVIVRRRRDQPELGVGLVGGLDIGEAEDLGYCCERLDNLLLLERVPAERGQRVDAVVGQLVVALAGGGEIDLHDVAGADVDIVGGEPVDRIERIESRRGRSPAA